MNYEYSDGSTWQERATKQWHFQLTNPNLSVKRTKPTPADAYMITVRRRRIEEHQEYLAMLDQLGLKP